VQLELRAAGQSVSSGVAMKALCADHKALDLATSH